MAPNSLSPAYIVINYTSAYGAHKMTLPCVEYIPGSPVGSFTKWEGGLITATDMVDDFLTLAKPFFPATTTFDFYEVFTKETATADSVFRLAETLGIAGTSALGGWSKAAEATWSFKSSTNGEFKITMLDFDSGDGWDKVTFAELAGASLAFANYLTGSTHGFAARDDGQPYSFRQISYGLNKALRRKYNMN